MGDGFCNDETNIAKCDYDGGDCCGSCVITEHCLECLCLDNITLHNEVPNALIGNGFCNDETNNADCQYDAGDCCGPCPNTELCSECLCFSSLDYHGVFNDLVGDGFCNDDKNNPDCNYDHGDCCLSNLNKKHCSECKCSKIGIITSPGFPKNYDYNIALTWLIKVEFGQFIEIEFHSFDIEYGTSSCR